MVHSHSERAGTRKNTRSRTGYAVLPCTAVFCVCAQSLKTAGAYKKRAAESAKEGDFDLAAADLLRALMRPVGAHFALHFALTVPRPAWNRYFRPPRLRLNPTRSAPPRFARARSLCMAAAAAVWVVRRAGPR
jgi:hypothetical protein